MLPNVKILFLLLIHVVLGIFIGRFITGSGSSFEYKKVIYPISNSSPISSITTSRVSADISPNVHIVNLTQPINKNFTCIKTKTLLQHINTSICLHEITKDQYVSAAFQGNTSIWEEESVTWILRYLLRHPHLDFIDIGANIGTYTMYAAALGRFVLAIDCFAPNVERIHRAVQLTNVANRVVLVQNAIFTRSGEYLRLYNHPINIGAQQIIVPSTEDTHNRRKNTSNLYIVKTIRFDELLPILVARGIRGAIMKIDIEGAESFVFESGSRIFDTLEIPLVLIEWAHFRHNPSNVKVIMDFFAVRHYAPKTFSCQLLNLTDQISWPWDMVWVKINSSSFC